MSFTSYLVRKFDFSHENEFFRKFSESLNSIYKDKSGEHVLIGNISCNGHQMDALYITRGQITVIDFKDYHGELTFSENNPWKIKNSKGELIFVQGGTHIRNPFQQVKAYRFSLMDYLSHHNNIILTGIRVDINWGHIGCIVLFHNKITFNHEEIPNNVKKYFHIADENTIINLLDSLYSQQLELTDNDINSIIKVLDVKPENKLENHTFTNENTIGNGFGEERLSLIKRLLNKSSSDSLYKRIINFYKTLINTERFKEPEAISTYSFPLNKALSYDDYPLDITSSNKFHEILLHNLEEKFPKNIFIALNISIDGNPHSLLHTIILSEHVRNKDVIKINFNDFELYNKSLEALGLTEDLIEELTSAINTTFTFEEKLSCIRDILGVTADLGNTISVGLSNENLFSVQLISELNALYKLHEETIKNKLFKGYINNTSISNNEIDLKLDTIIQVTPLNKSQKKAVKLAFDQPLTVVTGPPGTGKSQVVLNIIANAIANGHSVLFASKNNKAIDTIRERFDLMIQEPYLLRTGSKDEISDNLKPQLESFISRKNSGIFNDTPDELKLKLDNVRATNSRLEYLETQIQRIPQVKSEINKTELIYKEKSDALYQWLDKLGNNFTQIFFDSDNNKVKVDNIELALLIKKIDYWQSGFISKLFFKWFHKTKFEREIRSINKAQSGDVYDYVQFNAPWVEPEKDLLDTSRKNLEFLIDLKANSLKLKNESENLQQLEDLQNNLRKELDSLELSKKQYEVEITQIESTLHQLGLEVLNEITRQRLNTIDALNTQVYLDYLPSKVWKSEDVIDFTNCSKKFISDFKAICLTSLSVKSSFPLSEEIFDLLIIDEASQCDIASALPLIYRSCNVVIIGDPLQLKHITSIKKFEEKYLAESLNLEKQQLDYVNKSLYDFSFALANKSSLESVFLDDHYRCHPQIINFSNEYFYKRRLGHSMNIQKTESDFHYGNTGINWINIVGEMHESKNLNDAEINRCIDLVSSLIIQFPNASIGIITPFKHQKEAIKRKLTKEMNVKVLPDTVHGYQGDEKDIIIFTTVVAENAPSSKANFINSNYYLLNVAITRARSSLYIIGNFNYCRNLRNGNMRTPLSNLAEYVNSLGRVTLN